jgi:TatA/E family protein of Tat protein translocase
MGKVEGLLILGAVIMLLFGAKQLPKLARSVGESARELKAGLGSDIDVSTSEVQSSRSAQGNAKKTRIDG